MTPLSRGGQQGFLSFFFLYSRTVCSFSAYRPLCHYLNCPKYFRLGYHCLVLVLRESLCLSRSLCLQNDSVSCVVHSTLYNKDAFSFDAWIHIESFLSPINQNCGNHMGISCQCGEQTANKLFNFFKKNSDSELLNLQKLSKITLALQIQTSSNRRARLCNS